MKRLAFEEYGRYNAALTHWYILVLALTTVQLIKRLLSVVLQF
jgi:hypothetical protein